MAHTEEITAQTKRVKFQLAEASIGMNKLLGQTFNHTNLEQSKLATIRRLQELSQSIGIIEGEVDVLLEELLETEGDAA